MLTINGSIVISDLGFITIYNKDADGDYLGTLTHMAPEIVEQKKYDQKVDVYSLGCLMFFLCGGELSDTYKLLEDEEDLTRFFLLKRPYKSYDSLQELINKMVKKDPSERISTDELLADPTIINYNLKCRQYK